MVGNSVVVVVGSYGGGSHTGCGAMITGNGAGTNTVSGVGGLLITGTNAVVVVDDGPTFNSTFPGAWTPQVATLVGG